MIHLGFTGTRFGMTYPQKQAVYELLVQLKNANTDRVSANHGDCIGADREFHYFAEECGMWMVGHPPTDNSRRAFCRFDAQFKPKPFLVRDKAIVDGIQFMLATPYADTPAARGGTWSTIRYAKQKNKKLIIVLPDGNQRGGWL